MAEVWYYPLMLVCFLAGVGFGWWRGYHWGHRFGVIEGRFERDMEIVGIRLDQRARESGAA